MTTSDSTQAALSPATPDAADLPQRTLGCEVHLLGSNPRPEWDVLAQRTPHAHLGASAHWYSIIEKAYRHRPLYLIAQEDDEAKPTLVPSFLVRRWPLKAVVISMPFLDAGGPLGESGVCIGAAIDRLKQEAQNRGAVAIELRSTRPLDIPVQPSLAKVTLVRSLPSNPDLVWRALDTKVRNQIRKAERSGISIDVGGEERLDDFYRVFAVNMRDLGSPVHSKEFFRQILEAFGPAARVVVARADARPVGGLIAINYGETRYVPWASTLRSYSALCPNMLMYWDTLRRASQDGMSRFDFGRSTPGSGTYRFKRQWGATDAQLFWYTVSLSGKAVTRISKDDATWAALSQMWSRLPLSVTRFLGPRIRKRLTQ